MKRLRQILNHLCLLVNSALNTKCKDVSFLVEMCQFVAALLLKPVSCSCLKCALSPSSCLNCFTWFHHLCQKYVCTCQMLEIQLTVTDARSFFGVSRKWRTSPDSLKRCSVLRLAVFGGTITCLQTAHMKIFLSLCIKCVCLYQWCRRMFAYTDHLFSCHPLSPPPPPHERAHKDQVITPTLIMFLCATGSAFQPAAWRHFIIFHNPTQLSKRI